MKGYSLVSVFAIIATSAFSQITLNTNFKVESNRPIDTRDTITTLSDTSKFNIVNTYRGLETFVNDIGKWYWWTGTHWAPSPYGTVTSVGLSMPGGFSVSGGPIDSAGTISVTTALNGPIRGNGSGFEVGDIDLASEVTGVLPIDNGGTGSTTLAGAGIATTVTGTVNYLPKYTAGTVLDNSQIYDDGTNVGIGTASPKQKLTINGAIEVGINSAGGGTQIYGRYAAPHFLNIYGSQRSTGATFIGYGVKPSDVNPNEFLSSASIASFNRSAITLGSGINFLTNTSSQIPLDTVVTLYSRMKITNNGNVGIGNESPNSKLYLIDDKELTSSYYSTAVFESRNSNGNNNPRLEIRHSTIGSDIHHMYTTGSADFSLSVANNKVITLKPSGNVGIGTTSPTQRLHVNGNILADGSSARFLAASAYGTASTPTYSFNTTNQGDNGMYNPADDNIGLVTNGTERLRITNAGNVGIGITTPLHPLHLIAPSVTEPATGDLYSTFTRRDYTNNNASSGSRRYGARNEVRYYGNQPYTNTGGFSNGVEIHNSSLSNVINAIVSYPEIAATGNASMVRSFVGYLGLNNTVTTGKIYDGEVYAFGGTTTNLMIYDASLQANNGTITNTYGYYCGDITRGTQTNQAYSFYASDVNARNYFGGNVGIGTTTPSRTLHVAGEARITDLTTDPPTRIVGADADGDLGEITVLPVNLGGTGATSLSAAGIATTSSGTVNYLPKYTSGTGLEVSQIIDNGTRIAIGGTVVSTDKLRLYGNLQIGDGTDAAILRLKRPTNVGRNIINFDADGTISNFVGQYTGSPFQVELAGGSSVDVIVDENNNETGNSFDVYANGVRGTGTLLFRVRDNGNVGINTASPSQRLHVSGNILADGSASQFLGSDLNTTISTPNYSFVNDNNTGISRPSSDNLGFVTNGVERMRISSTGIVRIGNENEYGTVYMSGSFNNPRGIQVTGGNSGGSAPAYYFRQGNGTTVGGLWANMNNDSVTNYYTIGKGYNQGLSVNHSNNRVSINSVVSFPNNLYVNGDVRISDLTTHTPTRIVGADAQGDLGQITVLPVSMGGTGTGTALTQGSVVFAGANGILSQDNNNLFWDDTNNRLGITNKNPQYTLDVGQGKIALRGGSKQSQFVQYVSDQANIQKHRWAGGGSVQLFSSNIDVFSPLTVDDSTISSWVVAFGGGTGADQFRIQRAPAGSTSLTTLFHINGQGNVGIGTTAPTEKLHVTGNIFSNGTNSQFLGNDGVNSVTLPTYSFAGNTNTGMYRPAADNIGFVTTGVERVRIDGNGQVGIGGNPTRKFTIKASESESYASVGGELLDSSGWTTTGWTGSFSTGFTHTEGNIDTLTNSFSPVVNTRYLLTFETSNRTTGSFNVYFGNSYKSSLGASNTTTYIGVQAETTAPLYVIPTSNFNGTIVISLKAIQAAKTPIVAFIDNNNSQKFATSISYEPTNIFWGENSGIYEPAGIGTANRHNTAFGNNSLSGNITGGFNTAIGALSLSKNTNGSQNTAVGYRSLAENTTGEANTAFGFWALEKNKTGNYNTSLGNASMYFNTTGGSNTSIGFWSLYNNTSGGSNTSIGFASLYGNTTGILNTSIGTQSGRFLADGVSANENGKFNTYIGSSTKSNQASSENETVIGYNAIGAGSNSVVLGNTAVTKTVLRGNVYLGQAADIYRSYDGTNDYPYIHGDPLNYNTFIGELSGFSSPGQDGNNNTAIGAGAMYLNDTGNFNTAIGAGALYSAAGNTANENTAIGHNSMSSLSTGYSNVAVGKDAMLYSTQGQRNVAIGQSAMRNVNNASSHDNVVIGNFAAGNYGSGNTQGVTTLSRSIMIGSWARPKSNSETNQIVIGHFAVGNGSNTVTIGNSDVYLTQFFGKVRSDYYVAKIDTLRGYSWEAPGSGTAYGFYSPGRDTIKVRFSLAANADDPFTLLPNGDILGKTFIARQSDSLSNGYMFTSTKSGNKRYGLSSDPGNESLSFSASDTTVTNPSVKILANGEVIIDPSDALDTIPPYDLTIGDGLYLKGRLNIHDSGEGAKGQYIGITQNPVNGADSMAWISPNQNQHYFVSSDTLIADSLYDYDTYVIVEFEGADSNLVIPFPRQSLKGKKIHIVTYGTNNNLTLNSTEITANAEFIHEGSEATSITIGHGQNHWQNTVMCMQTGASTYKWVTISQ